ncbi:MAG: insulinase family protein [Proteobacteria bacterium]|nr:insulinase family protein [Pseudomonadota bacterium]
MKVPVACQTHASRLATRSSSVAWSSLVMALWLAQVGDARAKDPELSFERYRLDNGLEVILHRDNSVPIVAVDVWYHVGSGDEVAGKSGFAHLFEHMLFQGSQHVGEDRHFEVLKTVGASGVNGSTNTDRTNYFEVVPSHQLETALWLESDRMGYLLPILNRKSLDNQIDVVRNEKRQRIDNVPYGSSYMELYAALYPEGHPYHHSVIGKHEDLASATVADVVGFYETWYAPANATLVIAGDFETTAVRLAVQKWFGSFPLTSKPAHRSAAVPEVTRTRKQVPDAFAKLRQITYAWHTPAAYREGDAEFDILADVLASRTGRLEKILVQDRQLAQRVSARQTSQQLGSYFQVSALVKSGADLGLVERIMKEEIGKVVAQPVSQREFDRAVVGYEARFVWRLESLIARAETLHGYNHYLGDPGSITRDLDRFRKSSPSKVQSFAAKHLTKDKRIEILTLPTAAASTS